MLSGDAKRAQGVEWKMNFSMKILKMKVETFQIGSPPKVGNCQGGGQHSKYLFNYAN